MLPRPAPLPVVHIHRCHAQCHRPTLSVPQPCSGSVAALPSAARGPVAMFHADSPGPWPSAVQLPATLPCGTPATSRAGVKSVPPECLAGGPEGRALDARASNRVSRRRRARPSSQSQATSCRSSQSERPGVSQTCGGPCLSLLRRSFVRPLWFLWRVRLLCAIRHHRVFGERCNG